MQQIIGQNCAYAYDTLLFLFVQINYLSVIGGNNLRQTVARTVDSVISHEGQLAANLEGRVRKPEDSGKIFGIRGPLLTLICGEPIKNFLLE